jgi:hypothetical protein
MLVARSLLSVELTSSLVGWGSLSLFLAEVSTVVVWLVSLQLSSKVYCCRNTQIRVLLGFPIPRRRRRILMLRQKQED